MNRIYLDNAATTALDPAVLEAMVNGMASLYGNPSSIHTEGRETRSAIERARKKIAGYLNCTPSEIFFTSGGTEADNMAIQGAVLDLGVKHILTTRLEHHAVLHTVQNLAQRGMVDVTYIDTDREGKIDPESLRIILSERPNTLVSLMEANNEIGTRIHLEEIGNICEEQGALFHSDTVQTMGHYPHDLQKQKVHFLACAAHKFHGPKGIGFIYIRNTLKIHPFIHGGSQERNMRGGTENLIGILGLEKAFELAENHLDANRHYIQGLKDYLRNRILREIPGSEINGAENTEASLFTVLNISFPESEIGEMLLFSLDIEGISASGGSACTSGSEQGSHVLTALDINPNRPSVRFSFSKFNTQAEVDQTLAVLKKLVLKRPE